MATKWWTYSNKVILEHGVSLIRDPEVAIDFDRQENIDSWVLITLKGSQKVTIEGTLSNYSLVPLLSDIHLPPNFTSARFLLSRNRDSLEIRHQRLTNIILNSNIETRTFQKILHLNYIVNATIFRCKQLTLLYEQLLMNGVTENLKFSPKTNSWTIGNVEEPFYEFESLIIDLIRSYETMRFLMWESYGNKGGTPSNYSKTVDKCSLPATIREKFASSIIPYEVIKDYRDCVVHYAHFGARLPLFFVDIEQGDIPVGKVLIPDNPQAKSYQAFTYLGGLDALSFGWRSVNELSEVASLLIENSVSSNRSAEL